MAIEIIQFVIANILGFGFMIFVYWKCYRAWKYNEDILKI